MTAGLDFLTRTDIGPWINVTNSSYGADPTGTIDSTVALQKAIDVGVALGIPTIMPPGDYLFSGLTITDKANVVVEGVGIAGEVSKVRLLYTGSTVGITIDRVRNSRFGNFQLLSDDGTRKLTVGLDIDQKTGTGSGISTANYFHDIQIYNATTGVRLSHTAAANNELHTFERVTPRLDSITSGTVGWLIEQAQSKFHNFIDCGAGFCDTGIKTTAGSFDSLRFNYSHNNVDNLFAVSEPITILYPQSENAGRFLNTSSTTNPQTVTVIGGRLNPSSLNADNKYIIYTATSPLTFIGTDFADGTSVSAWRADFGGNINVPATFIGCTFPNSTPLSGTANAVLSNNAYISSGNAVLLPNSFPVGTSVGNEMFGLDASKGTKLSIANNATATPFSNANVFSGMLMINDPEQTGEMAMFIVGGSSAVALVSQTGTLYSTTSGTAGKVNVYPNSGVITIENKQGATIGFRVFAIRMRNSG